MSAILNTRSFLAAAAGSVLIAVAMSAPASASVTSKLSQCKANSRNAVVSCCNGIVRARGVPMWLESRDNCEKAVVCAKHSNYYKCYISVTFKKPGDDSPGKNGGKNYNTKP